MVINDLYIPQTMKTLFFYNSDDTTDLFSIQIKSSCLFLSLLYFYRQSRILTIDHYKYSYNNNLYLTKYQYKSTFLIHVMTDSKS